MARLKQGHPTIYTFSLNPTIKLWEREVTPPGISGRGPVDSTSMRNQVWTTQLPKSLRTLTESKFTAFYDPAILDDIDGMLQVNQLITIEFQDGSSWAFWGWIDELRPQNHREGEPAFVEVTVQPSNTDADGDEVGPVYAAA